MCAQYCGGWSTMFSILSVLHHGPTSAVPGYHIKTVSPFGGGHSEVFTHVPAEQGRCTESAPRVSRSLLIGFSFRLVALHVRRRHGSQSLVFGAFIGLPIGLLQHTCIRHSPSGFACILFQLPWRMSLHTASRCHASRIRGALAGIASFLRGRLFRQHRSTPALNHAVGANHERCPRVAW